MNHAKTSFRTEDTALISDLQQTGTRKRKGEEILFGNFAYFIREGMHKYGLSEDEAFNAYSDGILSAIEKITRGSFEGRSSLKTYIYQIFHNKCVDLLRKKATNKHSVHRTVSITDMLFHISDTAKSTIQKLIEQADWSLMREKLNELGDTCRQLLLLSAEGNTDRQIAPALGYKTAESVKTSRLRCLERLRKLYKGG
jgi:RNA polymerase sigma factor (sigma-70 family)